MTMPVLTAKYRSKVAVTQLKKMYSVMSQALLYTVQEEGDYTSLYEIKDEKQIEDKRRKGFKTLFLLSIPLVFGLILLNPYFTTAYFGDDFSGTINVLYVLAHIVFFSSFPPYILAQSTSQSRIKIILIFILNNSEEISFNPLKPNVQLHGCLG